MSIDILFLIPFCQTNLVLWILSHLIMLHYCAFCAFCWVLSRGLPQNKVLSPQGQPVSLPATAVEPLGPLEEGQEHSGKIAKRSPHYFACMVSSFSAGLQIHKGFIASPSGRAFLLSLDTQCQMSSLGDRGPPWSEAAVIVWLQRSTNEPSECEISICICICMHEIRQSLRGAIWRSIRHF